MYLIRKIWNWCKRYRHRCGYGVHSPSDFFLITFVIYEKQAYYAYQDLKKKLFDHSLSHYRTKVNKLLFRLVNYTRPRTLVEIGCGNGASFAYMLAARTSMEASSLDGNLAEITEQLDDVLKDEDTLDFIHLGFTPYYKEMFQKILPCVNERSCVVVGGIYDSSEKETWWKELIKDERIRISYDLYDIGILFFEPNRYKQHYIINFL